MTAETTTDAAGVSQVERGVRPHALPFAVFDEFGKGADDRVQDYVATLVADNALLKATEQRLRKLLEGADRRAVANGKELSELAARAADVAGERAANAALTNEVDRLRAVLAASCDDERSQLWEAGPGGGCSRAITAEADVARLRAALLVAVRQSRLERGVRPQRNQVGEP